ncbi:glycosyltransferase involved in cell wall biosynthesis [Sphingomonas leidyi]|uniref:Glycosyltransferase involved in cell wall biosynthesis n=1 Tax=Sphingomonas leidyi TaxID=68569 RepID=A0A7X5UXT5_9SPHN|nr:glycosyltransferase involved in cell wall biosynthesis [Sphingomonas leidyi]
MRVLTFLHSFEPGGVERVALRLVRHWRAMGVEAPLFLGREDGALRAELADGLTYTTPSQPSIGTAWWETLWMIARLPAEIRRTRPDVLFVSGSTYTIVAAAMRLRFGKRCPAIVVKISNDLARRDLQPTGRFFWRLWLGMQARFAWAWVIMDEAIAKDLPPGMRGTFRVVHDPAIEESRIRAPAPRRTGAPRRFVAIGRLAPQKDYPLMLRAFAHGACTDETLTIYGDGPDRAALEALAAILGVAERVDFAGHVSDAASQLPGFDTLLLSSRYEGVPAVLIEALAAGLSVISTDSGAGVRSVLGDGRHGMIVARNEAAFAAAIADADSAPAPHASRGEHVRRFTIEQSAGIYLDTFVAAARGEAHTTSAPSQIDEFAWPVPPAR